MSKLPVSVWGNNVARIVKIVSAAIINVGMAVAIACPCAADAVEDFYKGKTITVVASTGAGGPLDLIARTIARHMARHVPGAPSMIVKNMPGGGHVLATNFMFTQAPKDGTFIATVVNSIPLHQVIDGRGVRYDARKFSWIGATGTSNLMTLAWHTSGFRTIADVMARELPTGATGVGSGTFMYTNAMNVVLGTRFKMVLGYASSTDIDLAVERGEVAARGGFSLSGIKQERPDWIRDKKVIMLVQVGGEREREYLDVPLMHELAKTPEQREILSLISSPVAIGRPFFAPPDVPADRLAALSKAFAATMQDEAFLSEARQLHFDLNSMSGQRLGQIVDGTINTPADAVAKTKAVLQVQEGAK